MQINRLIIRALLTQLDEQRFDSDLWLESVGLTRQTILGDSFTISIDVFGQLLENIVHLSQDERLGLKLGFQTPLSVLGKLGGLYQSCQTLAHMLSVMQQYIGWLDGINTYYWQEDGDYVHIITTSHPVWQLTYPLAARQMLEHNIGFSLRHKREYLGQPISPVAISMPYSRIGAIDLLETYFDCPIQFDQPHLQITLPSSLLTYRVPSASEQAFRAYEAELAPFLAKPSLYNWQVKRVLETQLGTIKPTLYSVARHLAQSPRSLQRRLQQEGTSFQVLLDEIRLAIVQHTERNNHHLSKSELADRLGFSEPASLSRFLRAKKSR